MNFNDKTKTITGGFDYQDNSNLAPEITSINPTSHSPILKGEITIAGTNFGTTASDITVWLNDGTKNVYKLTVISVDDT